MGHSQNQFVWVKRYLTFMKFKMNPGQIGNIRSQIYDFLRTFLGWFILIRVRKTINWETERHPLYYCSIGKVSHLLKSRQERGLHLLTLILLIKNFTHLTFSLTSL